LQVGVAKRLPGKKNSMRKGPEVKNMCIMLDSQNYKALVLFGSIVSAKKRARSPTYMPQFNPVDNNFK
jgi:hypothetical protein